MAEEIDRCLAAVNRKIADHQRSIEDRTILIEVLERDGHDVSVEEAELKKERFALTKKIAEQFALLQQTALAE